MKTYTITLTLPQIIVTKDVFADNTVDAENEGWRLGLWDELEEKIANTNAIQKITKL